MDDPAAVESLLDNLSQLIKHHMHLIADVRSEVERLTDDLKYLEAFLRYASRSRRVKDERFKGDFARQIRDVLYDAEDTVDAFVIQRTMSLKSRNWLRNKLFADSVKLDDIVRRVHKVRIGAESMFGRFDMLMAENGDDVTEKHKVSPVRETNVVGLEEETDEIIGYLNEDTLQCDIISIVGMPGVGKSTLARKIFLDSRVQFEFPTRLWVTVSNFTPKDVLLSILREFESITEDMRVGELEKKVKSHLERGKILIVMDDVWPSDHWRDISSALPANNYLLKVLITSRYVNFARYANPNRPPHNLRPLGFKDSVKLLQYEVFGEPMWDPDLELHGKQIAESCKGLPLAIVAVGGIIEEKLATIGDNRVKVAAWETFSRRISEYLLYDRPATMMDKAISLSYDLLPYHLRLCFLYMGMFPKDFEIPTWKLFAMWIAEGFVRENTHLSLEETAENYLEDLIDRSLVTVDKRSSDGRVKTCRIHDSLWGFCKRKAGKDNENFLAEIRKSDGISTPAVNDDNRRLCIHSHIPQFLSSIPSGRRVRSFVCFSEEDVTLQPEYLSAIPSGFKMVRVLDVKPIKFSKIPGDMYRLLHLRYIHLSFNSNVLPRDFSRLWNMQTLIVETPCRTLEIKADIWEMRRLRHVKTNAISTLPEPTAQNRSHIQTLGTISPENFTDKVFDRARNLRRLSIRGKLKMLLISQRTGVSFNNMTMLQNLEKLKLENDVFPGPPSEDSLPHLPPSWSFPPNLRILTLSRTFLDWGQMEVLGSLNKLEVLKLKEEAFTGNCWATDDGGFSNLKVLFIEKAKLVIWKMSGGIFPNLRHLELKSCNDLQEVPIEFSQKPSLQVLILNHCRAAVDSAKEIKMKMIEANRIVEFNVTIIPTII